ncbi:MAG: DUF1018 domain-containing protein [Desulfobacterales bacterium]|jgi:hypothetical protein|nr:DUF1018 domain-containing protein [Desulfobacterales bacterium]
MAMQTTGAIYGAQNKIFHRGCQFAGMPYQERKDDWIGLFREIAGRERIDSFADLTLGERAEVITHLQKRGVKLFNPRVPAADRDWQKGDGDRPVASTKRPLEVPGHKRGLVSKIGAILADKKLPWKYADAIAKKRFGVDTVEWCDTKALLKIVQMLAVYQKRQARRDAAAERGSEE